jgi:iron complex transport system permease protein
VIFLLFLVLLVAIEFSLIMGAMPISPLEANRIIIRELPIVGSFVGENPSPIEATIVLHVRLPRVLAGAVVGAALAVAGVVLQGLLRNPMADPYTIGVSAGASLGASLLIAFGVGISFGGFLYSLPITAFVFALATVLVVYAVARTGQGVSMLTLLLVGVAINTLLLSMIAIVGIVSGEALNVIMTWLFGSLVACNWNQFLVVLPLVVIGILVSIIFARDLNMMAIGEEGALHLGVDPERLKNILLVSATLITAAVVSISGTIGFVGLIIPHIVRILVGSDNRVLIPASALMGAIMLVLCDTMARTILAPAELPVGIFTSVLGCPFFVYLLKKNRKRTVW